MPGGKDYLKDVLKAAAKSMDCTDGDCSLHQSNMQMHEVMEMTLAKMYELLKRLESGGAKIKLSEIREDKERVITAGKAMLIAKDMTKEKIDSKCEECSEKCIHAGNKGKDSTYPGSFNVGNVNLN